MSFIRRCATILAGYFAAATAGLIIPACFIFIGVPDSVSLSTITTVILGITSLILIVGGSLLVPALFVIAICEALCIRNLFAYLTLGVVAASALTIYTIGLSNAGDFFNLIVSVAMGVVAGFFYWQIAGRNAGEWRAARRTGSAAPP